MFKRISMFVLGALLGASVGKVAAITVNPASSVTADSAATALTIPYRDANGDFSINALSAASVSASSSTASGVIPLKIRGAYNSAQISLLSASVGEMVLNIQIPALCFSSATAQTGSLVGAWIVTSTAAANVAKVACY